MKNKLSRRTWLSVLLAVVLIPVTLFLFYRYQFASYYLISVIVLLLAMLPFFLIFEGKHPQAREVVTIAVLCAIAVAARAAFIAVPHFKPMTAIIMIAGIAFGPEAGFLTGSLSAFASNFIFGQGPWTPWQMFAFGIAGFLAGLLVRCGWLKPKRWPLTIFGAVCVFCIVGPLLDTCTLFLMTSLPSAASVGAIYLSGMPVNAVHALATALTLAIFAKPMLEKLDRLKLKYGMMEGPQDAF
jgi:energy-coupling factor transport system substrate-specific component